jgi:hypothetical protein
MIVVVEIINREGQRATKEKEYDAPSMQSAIRAAARDRKNYPQFRVTDIWEKGQRYSRELSGEW